MEKIIVEIPAEYRETMDFLKQVLAGKSGEPVQDDTELFEVLISGFMAMVEQEVGGHDHHDHGHHHEHGEHCNHDH
ncbi:MAG: hypothetical protein AB7E37_04295 [Candidatus Altimarinota bacterium]